MTTRRLVLIRHAKAAQGGLDIDRPLAEQGMIDAPAIGRWLIAQQVLPDRAVVSPARRAAQTWQLAGAQLASDTDLVVDERMYANTPEYLLQVIRETPAEVGTLALLGHNPSIADLADVLDDGDGEAGLRAELARKYPTSGVGVFELPCEWEQIDSGSGRLVGFAAPRG